MKKILSLLLLLLLLTPVEVSAAWWNPFDWFESEIKEENIQMEQKVEELTEEVEKNTQLTEKERDNNSETDKNLLIKNLDLEKKITELNNQLGSSEKGRAEFEMNLKISLENNEQLESLVKELKQRMEELEKVQQEITNNQCFYENLEVTSNKYKLDLSKREFPSFIINMDSNCNLIGEQIIYSIKKDNVIVYPFGYISIARDSGRDEGNFKKYTGGGIPAPFISESGVYSYDFTFKNLSYSIEIERFD